MASPQMPNTLFVYGSLRQSCRHPQRKVLDDHASFLGLGSMAGDLFNFGDYPGAIYLPDSKTKVVGEIYQLRDEALVLSALDQYEECGPSFDAPWEFVRHICPIETESRKAPIEAWCYLYNLNVEGLDSIAPDYLAFLKKRD